MKGKIINVVEDCLAEDKSARNSDWILFRDVCKKLGINVESITVKEMCENSKMFPSFESVTRARRKLQEGGLYPATEVVQKGRVVRESEYRKMYGYGA